MTYTHALAPCLAALLVLSPVACSSGGSPDPTDPVTDPPKDAGAADAPRDVAFDVPLSPIDLGPAVGYLGRSMDVSLIGSFDAPPAIDFGAGVEVSGVELTAVGVIAHLRIAADAPTTSRDVAIATARGVRVLPSAFRVSAALEVEPGPATQGALLYFGYASLDPMQRIETSPVYFGRDLLTLPQSIAVPSFSKAAVLVAPAATTGPRPLEWNAGSLPRMLTVPDAVVVSPGIFTSVTSGFTSTDALLFPQTKAFRFTAASPRIVTVTTSGMNPALWLFASPGHEEDRLRADAFYSGTIARDVPLAAEAPEDLFAIEHTAPDLSASLTFSVSSIAAPVIAAGGGAHDTAANAVPADACASACILTGAIAADAKPVVFVVNAPRAAMVGHFVGSMRSDRLGAYADLETNVTPYPGNFLAVEDGKLGPTRSLNDPDSTRPLYVTVRVPFTAPARFTVSLRWVAGY